MFNVLYIAYNPPQGVLNLHLNIWRQIPDNIRRNVRFILVDDCSNTPINPTVDFPINLTIARIDTDIYWNPPGAKNLGFTLADNDWVFSCDIDHSVPVEDYIKMIQMSKEKNSIYFFTRFLPNGKSRNKDSSNLFIIHKEDFWKTGGYDEDFCGNHGYDDYIIVGNFYNNTEGVSNTSPSLMKMLNFKFVRTDLKIIEHKEFATGDPIKKEQTNRNNFKILMKKIKELQTGTYIHPSILRFPWHIEKEITFN